MDLELKVFEIPVSKRYWVVRSGTQGTYFNNFREHNITAIGHVDDLDLSNSNGRDITNVHAEFILQKHKKYHQPSSETKSRISNLNGQIARFINDIEINDIIITVTANHIMAGRVLSCAYVSNTTYRYTIRPEEHVDCKYKLVRRIAWGRKIKRSSIPYELENSLRNSSTVFEINKPHKVDILNHWLAPIHIKNDTLHISSRIGSNKLIANHPISKFSHLLDQLELLSNNIAKNLEDGKSLDINYLELYSKNEGYDYVLTTQQAFMSPGHHFIQLAGRPMHLKVFALLVAALFDNSLVFSQDNMPNISPQDNAIIIEISNKKKEEHGFNEIKEELKLTLPKQDDIVLDSSPNEEDEFPETEPSDKLPL